MQYHTNDDLIQLQKDFIIAFLERTEGIAKESIVFYPLIRLPITEFEPLHSLESVKSRVEELMLEIEEGVSLPPILVEKHSNIIMDGSHRYLASECLGHSHIPILFYHLKK